MLSDNRDMFVYSIFFVALCTGTVFAEVHVALVHELTLSTRGLETHPDLLYLNLRHTASDTPASLSLQRTRGLDFSQTNIVLDEPVAEELRGMTFDTTSLKDVGYYQDLSNGAVLSVTKINNKRHLYGTLVMEGKTFEIKPVSKAVQDLNDLLETKGLAVEEHHSVHTLEEVTLPTETYEVDYIKRSQGKTNDQSSVSSSKEALLEMLKSYIEEGSSQTRHKRAIDPSQTSFHVDLKFLIEHSLYKYWMAETANDPVAALEHIKFFYSHIFHGIYLMYYNIESNTIAIRPWLKSMNIATTQAAASYAVLNGDNIDLEDTEAGIHRFVTESGGTWANPDHTMMWTKRNLALGTQVGILGLAADICGICKPRHSITQNHEYGLFSYFTGAHELGHVLGALHDDTKFNIPACHPNRKHLMTPYSIQLTSATYGNSFRFSECSVYMFEQCFEGKQYNKFPTGFQPNPRFPRTCVYDTICTNGHPVEDAVEEALPGTRYSLDEQCQLGTGDEQVVFNMACQKDMTSLDVCKQLYCKRGDTCTNGGNVEMRAASGSPCSDDDNDGTLDDEKVCWMGNCVDKDSFDYTPDETETCVAPPVIPESCQDQANDCADVVLQKPQECFGIEKQNCPRSCMQWGLYNVNDPSCGNSEMTTTTTQQPPVNRNVKYILCGYDINNGFMIQCPNHPDICYPMWYFGDTEPDCPDGADEVRAHIQWVPSGIVGYVRCPNRFKKLIPEDWMCDGENDCSKRKNEAGPDEIDENCANVIPYCDAVSTDSVNCPNDPRRCVHLSQLCNGVEDCGSGADALDEDPSICAGLHNTQCGQDQFACPQDYVGRACVYNFEACDGYNDCYSSTGESVEETQAFCNSLPEVECTDSQFHCEGRNFYCLQNSWICDSEEDCPGTGSDERSCPDTMKNGPDEDQLVRSLGKLLRKRTQKLTKNVSIKDQMNKVEAKKRFIQMAAEITANVEKETGGLQTKEAGRSGKAISLEILRALIDEAKDNNE